MNEQNSQNNAEALIVMLSKRNAKKIRDLPRPMQILQRRTMNTAFDVLTLVDGIPFQELSMSLYFYTKDVQMADFTRKYESQLEFAASNPEKFAFGLHKFLNDTASKIHKDNLYDAFFELYYRCVRAAYGNSNPNINSIVIRAYMSILCQQTEYLKPDKFDYSVSFAGRATTGELLTKDDVFSNFDLPGYEIQDAINARKQLSLQFVQSVYAKYGYHFSSYAEYDLLGEKVKLHSSAGFAMLPFINEYTYDILPITPFSANGSFLLEIEAKNPHLSELMQTLKKRKHTLPANGVQINFADNPVVDSILFKEILYDNKIFMLYRYSCKEGDLSGFYDTKEPYFYSKFIEHNDFAYLTVRFMELILYCYACYVLNDPLYQIPKIDDYFLVKNGYKLSPTGYLQGGKLRDTYHSNNDNIRHSGTARIGNDNYEQETKAIQGYIRRLPNNQSASEDAKALAESLGYDLALNETYVRPFTKQVFRLRENKS